MHLWQSRVVPYSRPRRFDPSVSSREDNDTLLWRVRNGGEATAFLYGSSLTVARFGVGGRTPRAAFAGKPPVPNLQGTKFTFAFETCSPLLG
jgi:hypothetical protein